MIPTVSPPTDNLYKFIALFGLIIFVFSLHKSGDVFDKATKNKIDIQDLKNEIQLSYPYNSKDYPVLDTASVNVVPVLVKRLGNDLNEILDILENSDLDIEAKLNHETSVRKLLVKNDSLKIKITEFYITLVLGLLLMIFGFVQWYRKDQSLKDKILDSEFKKKFT